MGPVVTNNIYPDLSNSAFDVKYARRLLALDDILIPNKILGRKFDDPDEVVETPSSGNCGQALTLIARFRVGAVGAPMIDGDTVYTNAVLASSACMVMVNGRAIHQLEDEPGERYCSKAFADDFITFSTGVTDKEVIEIYKASVLIRFRVGAVGSPMVDGATTYTNALLANCNFMLQANGRTIHQLEDEPGERYCSKALASDTITINGGVTSGEVIEIYLTV